MSIGTYADLQTAALSWSHRTTDVALTAAMPDLITLCEARLNDMLVLRTMESDEALTITSGNNYVALPTGFVSPIAFWIVLSGLRVKLDEALPAEMRYGISSSIPRYWAIDGVNVLFDCPVNQNYSAYLRCIKQSNLSNSNTTNALLTKRPDVYLAGTMVEVGRYIKDDEMIQMWEQKFLAAVAGLKASDNRSRGIVPLRTDISPISRTGNILIG